jgi:hypothetical protein
MTVHIQVISLYPTEKMEVLHHDGFFFHLSELNDNPLYQINQVRMIKSTY